MKFACCLATLFVIATPAMAQAPSPWGARAVTTCPPLKTVTPPTAAQAAQLVRCARESASSASGELWLAEKVVVKLGAATHFRDMYNVMTMADADTTKTVYPITGSWTWAVCILKKDAALSGNADRNCRETDVVNAKGGCWVTRTAGWKCNMTGASGETRQKTLPPK
jgi:hypothetical protein